MNDEQKHLKKQLVDIIEKKKICIKNIKNKTYSQLKSEYDSYINNMVIESGNRKENIELSKDIVNKLWLEILE